MACFALEYKGIDRDKLAMVWTPEVLTERRGIDREKLAMVWTPVIRLSALCGQWR